MRHPYFKLIGFSGIFGGFLAAIFVLLIASIYDDPFHENIQQLDFIVFAGTFVLSIWYYRSKIGKGSMSFWEIVVMVSLINLIILIFFLLSIYCYYSWIDQGILTNYKEYELAKLEENAVEILKYGSEEDYLRLKSNTKDQDIFTFMLIEGGKKLIFSFFAALVLGVLFRIKKEAF